MKRFIYPMAFLVVHASDLAFAAFPVKEDVFLLLHLRLIDAIPLHMLLQN
jgi:hypothetical protein